jgi:hypothetical protein
MKIANKKKLVGITAFLIVFTSGIFLWNAPGVKSQRLGKQCINQQNNFARNVCYTNIARKYQNTQLCDLIDDESQRKVCNINVYYWNKSVEDCDGDDQRNICLHILSTKKNDKSICSKINDETIKNLCLQED